MGLMGLESKGKRGKEGPFQVLSNFLMRAAGALPIAAFLSTPVTALLYIFVGQVFTQNTISAHVQAPDCLGGLLWIE